MADPFSIGIAVDSGPAVSGLRNLEAAAKRAGISVDEMQARLSKASAGAAAAGAKMAASVTAQSPALTAASRAAAAHATQLSQVATSTQKATAATAFFARGLQSMLVVLVGGGIYKALEAAVSALGALGDRMQDTRLSGETLQGLRIGAAEARVSTDELNKALDTFTDVSKKSSTEAKEFYRALSNISPAFASAFQAQSGKAGGQDERLRLIADALRSARSETERYQLAQKALGTDNDRVIDMFVRDRQAIDEYIAKAREYGVMVDDAFIKKAQEAQKTLGVLTAVIADKLRVAIVDIIPDIQRMLPFLDRIAAGIRDVFASFALPAERPTATLEREIRDSAAMVQSYQQQLDDARGSKGKSFFGTGLGDWEIDAEIKRLEGLIAAEKKFQESRKQIIAGRPDAMYGPALPQASGGTAPGFSPRPGLRDIKTPFDSAEASIRKHIAAMNADAEAVGKTSAEHARLRVEAQLVEAGLRSGLSEAAVRSSEKFKELGQAAQDAAQKLALARVNDQIKFDRDTGFLSQQDVQIAQQLRDIYPDVAAALSSVEAQAMRVNDAMRGLSGAIENSISTGLSDLVSGSKSAKDAFSDMADGIVKAIQKMIIQMMIVQPLMRGLQGALGGIFGDGGVFGVPSIGNGHGLYAKGGVFANDNIPAFAKGGTFTNSIVNSPTLFRFAQGTGLMGEAGPEAIMPLKRAPDGSLGVAAQGGGQRGLVVNFHNAPAGTEAGQATLTDMPGGGMQLDVVFKPVVQGIFAEDMNTGGPMRKTMEAAMRGFNGR
jgi:hypothetical protein